MREITLDFTNTGTPEQVHALIAEKLEFPAYYGANLDALYDCLTELTGRLRIRVLMPAGDAEADTDIRLYLQRIWRVMEDAAEESDGLTVQQFNIRVRPAGPADLDDLLDIYAWYVGHTELTYEHEAPSADEFCRRFEETQDPYLVLEQDGKIRGYACGGMFIGSTACAGSAGAACGWSDGTTVYIAPDACGCGFGRKLYDEYK